MTQFQLPIDPPQEAVTVFGYIEGSFLVSRTGDARERHAPNMKSNWRSGLKDLMRWILGGHLHLYGDILSGGLLPEGTGAPDEEAALIESRKDELCVATIESVRNCKLGG